MKGTDVGQRPSLRGDKEPGDVVTLHDRDAAGWPGCILLTRELMSDRAPARDLRRPVTCILNDLQTGRPEASDQLLPLLYDPLRAIAQQRPWRRCAGS